MTEFEEQALALLTEIRDLLTPKVLPQPVAPMPAQAEAPVPQVESS